MSKAVCVPCGNQLRCEALSQSEIELDKMRGAGSMTLNALACRFSTATTDRLHSESSRKAKNVSVDSISYVSASIAPMVEPTSCKEASSGVGGISTASSMRIAGPCVNTLPIACASSDLRKAKSCYRRPARKTRAVSPPRHVQAQPVRVHPHTNSESWQLNPTSFHLLRLHEQQQSVDSVTTSRPG